MFFVKLELELLSQTVKLEEMATQRKAFRVKGTSRETHYTVCTFKLSVKTCRHSLLKGFLGTNQHKKVSV